MVSGTSAPRILTVAVSKARDMQVLDKELVFQESSERVDGYDHAVGPCRFFLRLLGAWPDPHRKSHWTSTLRVSIVLIVMFLFATVSQTVKMLLSWKDLNVVTEILSNCNIPTSIAVTKIATIWYHRHVLENLVREIIVDWKTPHSNEELSIMWENARMSRFFSTGCIFLTEGTLLMQCAVGLSKPISYALNSKMNDTSEWPLYMMGSFPYDAQATPNYQLSIGGQLLSNVFASISFSISDAFFVVLMLHLIGQLTILKLGLRKLPENIRNARDEIQFVDRFSIIHTKYNQLWRFSMAIEETFSTMFLLQMAPCMFVLCTQGYQLIMILDAEYISPIELIFMIYFVVLFLFTIFIYCYVAELLRQESVEISHAAYNCNWSVLPAKEAKLLIFVISRAQHPFVVTVGKLATFSLQLYCQILKSSAGFLSMLLAIKKKSDEPLN